MRGHAYKLFVHHSQFSSVQFSNSILSSFLRSVCRVDIRKHFFCNRIVKVWNSLPAAADDFATVRSFTQLIERVDLSEHLVY